MSRKIEDLVEKMQPLVKKALEEMNHSCHLKWLGVDSVAISETKRSLAVQMAYYARGRMAIADVKVMYEAAGLYRISDDEAKKMNTWTLSSKHITGMAVDFVPVINGKMTWNVKQDVWDLMGKIGKECGLNWGGDWKQKDYPHFELPMEKTIK